MRLPVPGPLRMIVGLAADALGKLDSALSAERTPPAPEASPETTADDGDDTVAEMLRAVRDAQRAAVERQDVDLARRLGTLAHRLSQQPAEPRPDGLFPTKFARSSADDRIKDLRRQLLANTPRPGEDHSDDEH